MFEDPDFHCPPTVMGPGFGPSGRLALHGETLISKKNYIQKSYFDPKLQT